MKPHIAIIYNFNDIEGSFLGGSNNGIKKEISYFQQFLLSYDTIKENWSTEKFTYEFFVIHTQPFEPKNKKVLDSLTDVKIIEVEEPFDGTGLRCLAFDIDIDCDYRLVLDNDTLALKTPNFDFTKDALVSYGGSVYNENRYKLFCEYLGIKVPKEIPFCNVGYLEFNTAEYEVYYKKNPKNRLFPALNAGALLLKNDLSKEFSQKLLDGVSKIPGFAKKYGGGRVKVIQPIYGLILNDVTDNWDSFERGFNFILSPKMGITDVIKKYKGNIYLLHYINYSKDADVLNFNILEKLNNIKSKYYE
jgi:hypothetical protein